jgi:hypothetical protein
MRGMFALHLALMSALTAGCRQDYDQCGGSGYSGDSSCCGHGGRRSSCWARDSWYSSCQQTCPESWVCTLDAGKAAEQRFGSSPHNGFDDVKLPSSFAEAQQRWSAAAATDPRLNSLLNFLGVVGVLLALAVASFCQIRIKAALGNQSAMLPITDVSAQQTLIPVPQRKPSSNRPKPPVRSKGKSGSRQKAAEGPPTVEKTARKVVANLEREDSDDDAPPEVEPQKVAKASRRGEGLIPARHSASGRVQVVHTAPRPLCLPCHAATPPHLCTRPINAQYIGMSPLPLTMSHGPLAGLDDRTTLYGTATARTRHTPPSTLLMTKLFV